MTFDLLPEFRGTFAFGRYWRHRVISNNAAIFVSEGLVQTAVVALPSQERHQFNKATRAVHKMQINSNADKFGWRRVAM